MKKRLFYLSLIIFLGTILRLYQLDSLPAEMWGDIIEGYKFTKEILAGNWPLYFVLGNGPLYFYFAAFLSMFFGLSFFTLKLTSIVVGIILIIGTYLFTKELFNRKIALITAYLLAVSKWPLIYSKLGNMNILVVAFIAFIFYFLVKAIKNGNTIDFILVGFLAGIGLYNYPAFLAVPATLMIIFIHIFIFNRKIIRRNIIRIVMSIVIFTIVSLPFLKLLPQLGFTDRHSYFGSKLLTSNGRLSDNFILQLFTNAVNSLSMFHIKGDVTFRVNPNSEPHVDKISGIFLMIGIYFVLFKEKLRQNIIYIILPFFTLQLPAILVVSFPREVPSATRSIGILPFLYILIAVGIYCLWDNLHLKLARFLVIIAILLILVLNFKSVFIDYPEGLPNRNTPFGKIIAYKIDQLPSETKIYIIGCCWGDKGQPEPNGIRFRLKTKRVLNFIAADNNFQPFECDRSIKNSKDKLYFVVNPKSVNDQFKVKECLAGGKEQMIKVNNYNVAWIYKYQK